MKRVNKNGNLSGAIGNLVFVNRDGKTHVRSKPKKVNQSTTIRGAATGFGKNSGHDRILREAITDKIQIRNYRCFSINHRTRLRLTIGESTNQDCTTKMAYLNPQPMVGTVFNNDWQWERATNFYPEYNLSGQNYDDCPFASAYNRQTDHFPQKCGAGKPQYIRFHNNSQYAEYTDRDPFIPIVQFGKEKRYTSTGLDI